MGSPLKTIDPLEERWLALLDVSESIALHRDLPALFHDLSERLHRVVSFDFLALVLHDPERNTMRLHILEGEFVPGVETGAGSSPEESPGGMVWLTQEPLIVNDTSQETRFPRMQRLWEKHNVNSFCTLPLTTAQRRLGALVFGCTQGCRYADSDIDFLQQVARQVAVAVDNALNYEAAQSYQGQLARERDRLRVLLEVNGAMVSNLDLRGLFEAIGAGLEKVFHHEYTSLSLYDPQLKALRLFALDFPQGKGLIHEDMVIPLDLSLPGKAAAQREVLLINDENLGQFQAECRRLAEQEGLRSGCILPLISRDQLRGTLTVASLRPNAFGAGDVDLLKQVAGQVAVAVDNAIAFREIAELKEKLAEEKLYLEDEIRTEHNFEEIVGESEALRRVLKQVETVAPTDSTVLILGETGTGKEVVARAIHNLSGRRERTFVKLNCAAIPSGLLESELFGHEKGAFTGAITQRIGRFELAHQGTLFLDEIGDIPLELQPKLLRVLQEHEFERLGSARTLKVDVRVVAATNRDLAEMVAEKQFRSDLYYRLNVFPVRVPPLRERREDIPLLVPYFAQRYARRLDKRIETIPTETMDALIEWTWPGNIRELENVIERAVILSRGPVLYVPPGEFSSPAENPPQVVARLEDAERQHIRRALDETKGVVGGPHGAAALLGMKRTTLQSKMRKLGIATS